LTGGVLNITAAAWTAGFHWWHSGNKTRTQNVTEYMFVLTLCLVIIIVTVISVWCRDGVGNTAEKNTSIFSLIQMH